MPSPSPPSTRPGIGASLEEARRAAGLTVAEAADRTKIRAKYLSALESDDWTVLPSSAYAKGFLRTYALMLGLDAEELVDEYRRTADAEAQPQRLLPFGDPVLSERRRPPGLEEPRGRRGLLLAASGVGAIAIALVLGLAGGLGDDTSPRGDPTHGHAPAERHSRPPAGAPSGPVALRLHAVRGAQVCLVGDGRAVIDSQALPPGAKAGPFHARRFRLDLSSFGGGALRMRIDGRPRKLVARQRSSYLIHHNGIKRTAYRGPRCP
jgi:transcriptional regulator with XRE-family HTH domain